MDPGSHSSFVLRCARCKGLLLVGKDSATLTKEDCQGFGYGYAAGDLLCFWCGQDGLYEPDEPSSFYYGHC